MDDKLNKTCLVPTHPNIVDSLLAGIGLHMQKSCSDTNVCNKSEQFNVRYHNTRKDDF
jgi:hypothetical protein